MHNLSEAIFSMMLQIHAWVKDPLKFPKMPVEFSAPGYEKLIDMILDSTLQIIFKKLKLAKFGIVPKKHIHNYLRKLLKYILLPFAATELCKARLSFYTSTKTNTSQQTKHRS